MKVRELIEILKSQPSESDVVVKVTLAKGDRHYANTTRTTEVLKLDDIFQSSGRSVTLNCAEEVQI